MFVKKSISRPFSVLFVIIFILSVTPLQAARAAGTRYAKPIASGTGNCFSWANACTLQSALTGAVSGEEIWVMAGTHKPTTLGSDRAATFQLKNGVAVYGGFAGTETARDRRDPVANLAILSGEIGAAGNSDNSYHVVTGASGATMDGFTITAGNADGASPNDVGGGMYNDSSSPMLMSVTFSGNSAYTNGGGMYNTSSNPTLTDVTFSSNSVASSSGLGGGGMYNFSSSPSLTNVTFSSNSAVSDGGGLFNFSSSPTLMNVTFSGNSAVSDGGGLYNFQSSSPILTNVTFSGNSATGSSSFGGGIANGDLSNPTLTNVTFSGNSATNRGGGLYNGYGNPQIRNAIFWGNTAPNGAQIYNSSGSYTAAVSDSVVQGGYAGGTNILIADPLLGTLGNHGGLTQTIPLLAGSSAVNTGNDTVCPAADQRGVARPQGAYCDIGAYEYDYMGVYYVKPAASGTGDCQSWANACTLQTALITSVSGDELWVAAGTHKPATLGTDRSATFQLKNGVAVYGGFAGTETARSQRNPAANLTILSGDIDNNDSQAPIITDPTSVTGNTTNSYHVVTGASGAALEGFTITAGYSNGGACPGGGGICNSSSSPTLTNLTFSGNSAILGGGMYNTSSSPTLTNVTFNGNLAWGGGGIFNNSSSSPTLTNVTFSANSATSTVGGGGIYNLDSSSPTLTNVTFSGNSAIDSGGGMYNKNSSNPQIRNTIFWGNTASSEAQIYNDTSSPVVSDSVVQGGYAGGTNIITGDPKLGTLGNHGGYTQTIPLLAGSSAIDTGNNAVCPATDQRGVARWQGAHCDIGAYEAATFTLTITSAHGTVIKNPNQTTYDEGDVVQLTATPAAGWTFDNWSGALTGSANPGSVTIHGNTSVTANYSQNGYTLTVTSASGTVTANPNQASYHEGDVVQLTATPATGWVFDYWTGALTGSANPASVTIHGNTSVTANYSILSKLTLTSAGAQDGWVLESSQNSNKGGSINSGAPTFKLGDDAAKRQYRAILSFSTGTKLPATAIITGATLKVKKQAILGGGSPLTIFKGFMVDIKNGVFGTAALKAGDFQAAASQSLGPFKPAPAGNWYSIDLSGAIANINHSTAGSGLTQIRLRFKWDDNNNAVANILSLYSGNAGAANRPQLIITYYVP